MVGEHREGERYRERKKERVRERDSEKMADCWGKKARGKEKKIVHYEISCAGNKEL